MSATGLSWWRRLRRGIATTLAALVILAAVAMALGQLLLPLIVRYPQGVASLLARQVGRPVAIASVQGQWQSSGPLFGVADLRIGTGADTIVLPKARLKVDFGAWLSPRRRWLELRLDGAHVRLTRDGGGNWHVVGIGPVDDDGDNGSFDGRLPVDLAMADLQLDIEDAVSARHLQLHAAQLRVTGRTGRLRLGAVLDDVSAAPLRVAAEIDPRRGDGRVYVEGRAIDLAAWSRHLGGAGDWQVESGTADVRAWLAWRDHALAQVRAELSLDNLLAERGIRRVDVPAWRGGLRFTRADKGWQVGYRAGTDAAETVSAWFWRDGAGDMEVTADAMALDLAPLLPWLQALPQVPDHLADWLRDAAPRGRVPELHLAWHDADRFRLRGRFDGFGFAAAHGIPGLQDLHGVVDGDGEAVTLELAPQATSVSVPGVFREPFDYRRVAGSVTLWRADSGWRLATDRLALDAETYAVALRGQCTFPPAGGVPVLDVAAVVQRAEVPAAKRFWPVNVMPAPAVEWLDRALVSGQVTGRAIFRGPLADFPFPERSGRFEAIADIDDMRLDFHPDWPVAEGVRGRARFVDNGMEVDVDKGTSLGVPADSARARIVDFDHAVLDLEVDAHGDAARMLSYLRKTPVGQEFSGALDSIAARGPARAGFVLKLPLDDDLAQEPDLEGHATLNGVAFSVPDWSLALDGLRGTLAFGADSLDARDLSATYGGHAVMLDIGIGGAADEAAHLLDARMRGRLGATTLVEQAGLDLLRDTVSGDAEFEIGLAIERGAGNAAGARRLTVDSDLAGIALALPAPLDKPAEGALPLHLGMTLPLAEGALRMTLGDVVQARLRTASPDRALAADIGLGEAAAGPEPGHLRVHGRVDALDLGGWLDRAAGAAGTDATVTPDIDIEMAHAMLGARDLGGLHLQWHSADEGIRIDLDGDAVAGNVLLPHDDLVRRGITARLDRLHWPEDDDVDAAAYGSGVNPAAIPPLHVWIRDLRLGHARLGDLRFESVPTAGGMQIEQLDAQSRDAQISARGRWSGTAEANATHLAIDFSSGDLGRMLGAFGYPGLVSGGTTLAHIDGSWAGPPSAFSLATLDGSMKVQVVDGSILDVNPGVGRLFGLFSIRELPRRLSLDFGDIFGSGFAFNRIEGNFAFADGNARTRDLGIDGPAAAISLRGRTGLRARDYDQEVIVTPRVGGALPVVGALAGGPVGAAAGLAVQGLIGKGLNRAAAVHYRITGSWAEPTIELLPARDNPRQAPSAAPAASAPVPRRPDGTPHP